MARVQFTKDNDGHVTHKRIDDKNVVTLKKGQKAKNGQVAKSETVGVKSWHGKTITLCYAADRTKTGVTSVAVNDISMIAFLNNQIRAGFIEGIKNGAGDKRNELKMSKWSEKGRDTQENIQTVLDQYIEKIKGIAAGELNVAPPTAATPTAAPAVNKNPQLTSDLHTALQKRNTSNVKKHLAKGADVTATDQSSGTALHKTATHMGKTRYAPYTTGVDVAKLVLDKYTNTVERATALNKLDRDKRTPVMLALAHEDIRLAELFLHNGGKLTKEQVMVVLKAAIEFDDRRESVKFIFNNLEKLGLTIQDLELDRKHQYTERLSLREYIQKKVTEKVPGFAEILQKLPQPSSTPSAASPAAPTTTEPPPSSSSATSLISPAAPTTPEPPSSLTPSEPPPLLSFQPPPSSTPSAASHAPLSSPSLSSVQSVDDINQFDKDKKSALHRACELGNIKSVEKLAAKRELYIQDALLRSPFHYAAMLKPPDGFHIFQLLIEGYPPDNVKTALTKKDNMGFSPLDYAISHKNSNVVELILKTLDNFNYNEIYDSVTNKTYREKIKELANSKNKLGDLLRPQRLRKPQPSSSSSQEPSTTQHVASATTVDPQGRTPLMLACLQRDLSNVDTILSGDIDLNARDNFDNSVLHRIAMPRDIELYSITSLDAGYTSRHDVAKAVLDKYSDKAAKKTALNTQNKDGMTPLDYAFQTGDVELAKLFLTNGAVDHKKSTLIDAINLNYAPIVDLILRYVDISKGADIHSLIQQKAEQKVAGFADLLAKLPQPSSTPSIVSTSSPSPTTPPLTESTPVRSEQRSIAGNVFDETTGTTPLHRAIIEADLEQVRSLIGSGANVRLQTKGENASALQCICVRGGRNKVNDIAIAELILEQYDSDIERTSALNHKNSLGYTILDLAEE